MKYFLVMLFFLFSYSFAQFEIIDNEYLYSPEFSVLAYHNFYPSGMQSGIELIHHEERIASNGDLQILLKGQEEPVPALTPKHWNSPPKQKRRIDQNKKMISLPFKREDPGLNYQINIYPDENQNIKIDFVFDHKIDTNKIEKINFHIDFYPEVLKGKSFIAGNQSGFFPWFFQKSELITDAGNKIILAPEDPQVKIEIETEDGRIQLIDDREESARFWFKVGIDFDLSPDKKKYSLILKPHRIKNFVRTPIILYNRLGYHPDAEKRIFVELDQQVQADQLQPIKLFKLNADGNWDLLNQFSLDFLGKYFRYHYAQLDFSEITQTGIYRLQYKGEFTDAFKIDSSLYNRDSWELSLTTFIPVQMCHMRVKDRLKLWHGACHLDDGLQAPKSFRLYDGFFQTENSDTQYEEETTIPGMNQGGWHDAGDDDVNTGSSGHTTYQLALAVEEFNVSLDQTSIDFEKKQVFLNQADGKSDFLQQIIHGVHFLLAQYQATGHSIVGMISSRYETYLQSGDWGNYTDNLFYHPDFPEDSSDGYYSGKKDDRYIFTNRDSRRDFFLSAVLATAARVLKKSEPEISKECIEAAIEIWENEISREPVFVGGVGTPGIYYEQYANSCVELFLTTQDMKFLQPVLDQSQKIFDHFPSAGWTLSRIINVIGNEKFSEQYHKKLKEYSKLYAEKEYDNPFNVESHTQVWGVGWNILWHLYKHYYLIKNHPDFFTKQPLLDGLDFILGRHPGSNLTFTTGYGNHRPIPAFGVNREEYSNIPGGIYSGTGFLFPDFPELKADNPYVWQQSEYIIHGASAYIFNVLAADALLNSK